MEVTDLCPCLSSHLALHPHSANQNQFQDQRQAHISLGLGHPYGWTAAESFRFVPLFPGASVTGDSQATVTRPIGWVGDQMPWIKEVGFRVHLGSKGGQELTLQGSLLLKTHSHRPSDQGTTQKKGRLDGAGLLKLLGLEGSLTVTQVK